MASTPAAAITEIVTRPVKVDGRFAEIDVSVQEDTAKVVGVVEPAGVAVTRQPWHCGFPKSEPVMVMAPPEATTLPGPLASGPTETMMVLILHRAAE